MGVPGRSDLSGTEPTGVNVRSAVMRRANLTGPILTGANLDGANFTSADLTDAVRRPGIWRADKDSAAGVNTSKGLGGNSEVARPREE